MFENRHMAGDLLARRLAGAAVPDPVVLALPHGGVPVAVPVADMLDAPLDVVLVRKIGMPDHPELAAGAVVDADGPVTVFNEALLRSIGRTPADFAPAVEDLMGEIAARRAKWLQERAQIALAGRTAIVVDDGIATGATMRAALKAVRAREPARLVLAIPVAPPDTLAALAPLVDEIICLDQPSPFIAVGAHYLDFGQVGDDVVGDLLSQASKGNRT